MARSTAALLTLALTPRSSPGGEAVTVSGEIAIAEAGQGEDIRGTPHAAFGQGIYLAVWREGWNGEGGVARICARRLNPEGKPLDPKPIVVAPTNDGIQELPRVAFGGELFLVVWQDFRNGRDCDVLGTRISLQGKALDASPIAIATGPRTQSAPDVASDGRDFLVAWQAVQGEENIYRVLAARVRADGQVGTPVRIQSLWTKAAAAPRLAWDGASYRVVFLSQSLLTTRLAQDGSPLSQEPPATLRGNLGAGIGFAHAALAVPGQGMLVVFSRSQPDYWGWGGPGAMISLLIGADGKPHAGIPKEDYPQTRLANWLDFGRDKNEGSPWPHGPCAVAWDGRQFVVAWQRQHITKTVSLRNSDIILSRVAGWKPLDSAGVPVAASELEEKGPALASNGAGKLVCVYEKHQQEGTVAIVARVIQVP